MKEVEDGIWVVTFLDYKLGYPDQVANRVEPEDEPIKINVLLMSSEWTLSLHFSSNTCQPGLEPVTSSMSRKRATNSY